MGSSPADGHDLGSVSLRGKEGRAALCDNVISQACSADYGGLQLSWEHIAADGIISEGCCDGIPAPSSRADEVEGVGLHRGSEPSCQANGNVSDCSESYCSGAASEPNKGHGVASETSKGHVVVSETNQGYVVVSEPSKSHGIASEPNKSHGVQLHHNFFVSGWMYPNESGQLCGPYLQQQLCEGLKSGFLPLELVVHPVLNGSIMNSVPLKYFNLYPDHVATGFVYLNAAGTASVPSFPAASAPRSEHLLHGSKSLVSQVVSRHPIACDSSCNPREPNSGVMC